MADEEKTEETPEETTAEAGVGGPDSVVEEVETASSE